MSNLNPQQFRLFHGTPHEIKGGEIEPTHQEDDDVWEGAGPTAAFASDRPDIAAGYGDRVYEVHPTGREDNYADHVYASESGFKVKRELKPEVVDRYKKIVGPLHDAKFRRDNYANVVHTEYGPDGVFTVHHDENGNVSKRVRVK